VELNELLSNTSIIRDGTWIEVDKGLYGDLRIKSRGYTDDFVDAQAALSAKARNELGLNPNDPLPNKVQREINAKLLREHLVLGVENLTNQGQAITVEQFWDMLDKENAVRLAAACWKAAGRVSARTVKQEEADLGN
jgi:hypothetical protein